MDINDLRGLGVVFCMLAFLAVVYWAYAPSRREEFERAGQLPFDDDKTDKGEQSSMGSQA